MSLDPILEKKDKGLQRMQIRKLLKPSTNFLYEHKDLILIITGSIFLTFLFAYIALIYNKNAFPSDFIQSFYRWDTPHYMNIAKKGYGLTEDTINLIAFFPLYPMLVKIFNFLFNNLVLTGLVISNIAYIIAAVFLYKLIQLDHSKETALRGVLFFSIFPTAFFLHAAYTESLFMALILSSFYNARKGNWLAAGLLGMFVTSTRITGVVLFPALIIEYLDQNKFKIKKDIAFLALVPLGFAAYLVINYFVFGDFFGFLTRQKAVWNKSITIPWEGFSYHFNSISWLKNSNIITIALSESLYGLLGLAYSIWAMFKMRTSYAAYCFLAWLVFTSTAFWLSIPRYTLALFPIFISMGKVSKHKGIHFIFSMFSLCFFYIYLSRFIVGQWNF